LDASGGSLFLNLLGAAKGASIRAAASTQPFGCLMSTKDPIPSIIVGLGAGIGVGAVVFVITFFMTFTICSDTSTAEKVFPFALIADPSLDHLIALVVALAQFPVYGLLLGFAWAKTNATKIVFIVSIVALLVLHLMAGRIATRRVERMWQQQFSQAGY
jgi:hypothetical protein